MMNINLKGKTALVTGGSKGIGEGAARALSQAGANVIICARNKQETESKAKEIAAETGFIVRGFAADVTKQDDIDKLFKVVNDEFGGVDILVNNAGSAGKQAAFMDVPAEDYLELYNHNMVSMVRFTKAVIPYMQKKNGAASLIFRRKTAYSPTPE